ncbi:endonuclease/exonuclease/phosphatase family protein [Lacticaseibacillus mingshuiensis]|uniref:Endonuclease/exonuclease/phosphatase family protein n=1 Tax=Lacticaseibacillus mingshuiensis TaxID=2799574 RepID=A0ABW4CK50_9LACO|nr:endonuclease/exonuclease/phosphatase family protein [Lacticaseibacillus mingshuiensis]
MKKKHRWWKILLALLGAVVIAFGGYLIYLFSAYHRMADDLPLTAKHEQTGELQTGKTYTAQTYNIGYGSYPPSYSFFMDGGKYSRAYSKKAVNASLDGIIKTTETDAPDIAFFQEVDWDGDRSQHVNEVTKLENAFKGTHTAVYGPNYDSPYLFYPFTDPIGKAKSGLVTLVSAGVTSARRYKLPIDNGLGRFIDLDRAFTATKVRVEGGKTLQLINIHMSAFTKKREVQQAQFDTLFAYIKKAYASGDYVIVAGDYNHTPLPDTPKIFGTSSKPQTWTHPFPHDQLPKGFYMPTMGLAEAKVPSARGLDKPYSAKSFVTLIDGFILSPNITAHTVAVTDTGFEYSDHNPVRLTFTLNK